MPPKSSVFWEPYFSVINNILFKFLRLAMLKPRLNRLDYYFLYSININKCIFGKDELEFLSIGIDLARLASNTYPKIGASSRTIYIKPW